MTLLVLGGQDDAHAVHVLARLRERGQDAEMLDSRWFPASLQLVFDPLTLRGFMRLPTGRRLRLEDIRSVYWRCYNGVQAPALPNREQAHIAQNDARSLFESLLIGLPCRWVNGWQGFQLHQTKPAQLARAAAAGAKVPRTLLTNDPQATQEFAASGGPTIFKPVQGGAHAQRLVAEQLLPERLQNLAYAPITLQEEVSGRSIRAFVGGERVLACEVASEHLDYRDDPNPKITAHRLPPDVESLCISVAARLDLLWTGMDFKLNEQGEYIFLEANPSPMFLGFEAQTGLPLTESLLRLLVE